jgi:hypothetical protein
VSSYTTCLVSSHASCLLISTCLLLVLMLAANCVVASLHNSTKGAAKTLGNNWPASKAAWVSALIAVGTALLTAVAVVPVLKIKSRKHMESVEAKAAAEAAEKRCVLGFAGVCEAPLIVTGSKPACSLNTCSTYYTRLPTCQCFIFPTLPSCCLLRTDTHRPFDSSIHTSPSLDLETAVATKTGVEEPKSMIGRWWKMGKVRRDY